MGGNAGGFGEPVPTGGWPVPGNAGAECEIDDALELVGTELDVDSMWELVEATGAPVVAGEQKPCTH